MSMFGEITAGKIADNIQKEIDKNQKELDSVKGKDNTREIELENILKGLKTAFEIAKDYED